MPEASVEGYLVSADSVPGINRAVDWVAQYGDSLIGPEQRPGSNNQRTPGAIRGWLMQDLAQGETALMNYAVRRPNVHSFQVSLFGLWDLNGFAFRLRLKFGEFIIGTTEVIGNAGVATADDVKMALHLATAIPLDRILVDMGNPAYSTLGNNNSLSQVVTDDTGRFPYPTASWNITFADYENKIGLELSVLDTGGGLISGSSVIISTRTYDVPTGHHVLVFDAFDLPLNAPLKRGSKVVAQWFRDGGYGVIAAMGRDFHDTSGDV